MLSHMKAETPPGCFRERAEFTSSSSLNSTKSHELEASKMEASKMRHCTKRGDLLDTAVLCAINLLQLPPEKAAGISATASDLRQDNIACKPQVLTAHRVS